MKKPNKITSINTTHTELAWVANNTTHTQLGRGSVNANNTKTANVNPLEGQGSINANNTKTANGLEYEKPITSKSTVSDVNTGEERMS